MSGICSDQRITTSTGLGSTPDYLSANLRALNDLGIPAFVTFYREKLWGSGIVLAVNSEFTATMARFGESGEEADYVAKSYSELHNADSARIYSQSDWQALMCANNFARIDEGAMVDVVKIAFPDSNGAYFVLGFFVVYENQSQRNPDQLDERLQKAQSEILFPLSGLADLRQSFADRGTVQLPIRSFLSPAKIARLIEIVQTVNLPFESFENQGSDLEMRQILSRAVLSNYLFQDQTLDAGAGITSSDLERSIREIVDSVQNPVVAQQVQRITDSQAPLNYLSVSQMNSGGELGAHSHSEEIVVSIILQGADLGGAHYVGRGMDDSRAVIYQTNEPTVIINVGNKFHGVEAIGETTCPRIGLHLAFGASSLGNI